MTHPDTNFRKEVAKKLAEIVREQRLSSKELSDLGIPVSVLLGKVHRHSLFDLMYYATLLDYGVELNFHAAGKPPITIVVK